MKESKKALKKMPMRQLMICFLILHPAVVSDSEVMGPPQLPLAHGEFLFCSGFTSGHQEKETWRKLPRTPKKEAGPSGCKTTRAAVSASPILPVLVQR